jgi:uncharacterized protein YabN with tetrapyrrole methylase and pyrophosphatase domain
MQRRAASVGFDWSDPSVVFGVLQAELTELAEAVEHADLTDSPAHRTAVSDEFGDVLFSAVNLARHLDIDPELALRGSADKFADRFRKMEVLAGSADQLQAKSEPELDALWRRAKAIDSS